MSDDEDIWRPDDNWGIGQKADGSIPSVEDVVASMIERDAEEAAFDELDEDAELRAAYEAEEDDFSDLDDDLPEPK